MNISRPIKLTLSVMVCVLTGTASSFFTVSSVSTWYETLNRPVLNPPSWVFGPVWTVLYILMGVSLFLVWSRGVRAGKEWVAIGVFVFQLVLNFFWSIAFFGAQNPALALINILLLWFSILITMILFYRLSKTAVYLLVPYLFWVTFATYLNYSIWLLN
jgi:translocator protein